MGAVCTRGCTSDERTEFFGPRRNNVISTVNNRTSDFEVTIECFSVPKSRLLSKQKPLPETGADCRSIVVTTIHIEKRQHTIKKLNSVLYTPVLQWIGIDVKHQVPKFLPMNLWPGSYTVFGFCNPDESSTSSVKLIGRVGTEQVCLEEEMDTEKSLTNEQWTSLSKHLEKELEKLNTFSPKHRQSHDISQVKEAELTEKGVVEEEPGRGQRDSLDTGYISNKRSLEQSVFSIQCTGNTSDSEDGTSAKDKQMSEKRLKMRRKDTPAHNLHHIRYSPLTQEFKAGPLQEESEATISSESESCSEQPYGTILTRPMSSLGFRPTEERAVDVPLDASLSVRDESNMVTKLSKSYQDIRGSDNSRRERTPSYCDTDKEKQTTRRKKRSIVFRIGGIPIKADSDLPANKDTSLRGKDSDLGADADDEEDPSYAESDKTTAREQTDSGDRNLEEEPRHLECDVTADVNTAGGEGSEVAEILNEDVCPGEQTNDKPNENYPEGDKKNDNRIEACKGKEKRKFSYSNVLERQKSSTKKGDNQCKYIHSDDKGNKKNDEMKEQEKGSTKEEGAKQDSVRESKKLERKGTAFFREALTRPRSRTFSSKNIITTEEKEGRSRYIRPSKSVSLPKKSVATKSKKKIASFGNECVESTTSLINISEPPATPKEAFSDA